MIAIEFRYNVAAEMFTILDNTGVSIRFDAKPVPGEYFSFCVVPSASAGPDTDQWDPAEYPDVLAEIQTRLAHYIFSDEMPITRYERADPESGAGTQHCWFRLIPAIPELPELWLLVYSQTEYEMCGRSVVQTTPERVRRLIV